MDLIGSIREIKSRSTVGNDVLQRLTLDVFGEFAALHDLMNKPLAITIKVMDLEPKQDIQ